MHKYTDTYCTYVRTHVDTHCSHIICIQLTMNHNTPHRLGWMRPPTILKAGIGWIGSAVTLSSLLSSLTTSPTSQHACFLIVSTSVYTITVLATTSGGLVNWTRTTLSDRGLFSPFILFTSSSVTNFSWYNSDSTVWDSSTDTQTGRTKHCYTMLIPKVYNVCGYTVTAEGRRNRHCGDN